MPEEIAGQFGPQLTALIAYLTVVCRLPRLVVQRLLDGALQIPISLGSTQKAWEEVSAAVAAPYDELQAALPTQSVLNADETRHRTNGDKRWIWALVARTFIFCQIATSRGSDVLHRLLGPTFAGILGSDRLPSYLSYAADQRQFCWSHFTRNLLSAQELAKTPAASRPLPFAYGLIKTSRPQTQAIILNRLSCIRWCGGNPGIGGLHMPHIHLRRLPPPLMHMRRRCA